MTKRTLEEIIELETARRSEAGIYGIEACKDWINEKRNTFGKGLYEQLESYVEAANNDPFFNKAMVLACWEMINER